MEVTSIDPTAITVGLKSGKEVFVRGGVWLCGAGDGDDLELAHHVDIYDAKRERVLASFVQAEVETWTFHRREVVIDGQG